MKFTVPSKTLHNFTSSVSKVISTKNPLTILNNFLFSVKGETLTITACDGENTLCGRIAILDVEGEGEFCIDARRIVELLRVMPEQELCFDVDDATLAIEMTHPNGSYKFMGFPGAEYPRIDNTAAEGTLSFTMPGGKLLRGFDFTASAAGTDILRPQMMGVYLDIKTDRVVFVATDTHKLVKFVDSSVQPGFEASFILPNKSTGVVRSVFTKDEDVTVTLDADKGVRFESETFTFDSRLVKGRFPDYMRVIPQNNPYILTADRLSFTTAVRRVSLFVDEGHGLIKFRVRPDTLTIKASDNEYNTSGIETLNAQFTGSEMVVGFSSTYLSELAGLLWTDEIVFQLADPSRPAVIVPTDNKPETELTMLLMPMNVIEF